MMEFFSNVFFEQLPCFGTMQKRKEALTFLKWNFFPILENAKASNHMPKNVTSQVSLECSINSPAQERSALSSEPVGFSIRESMTVVPESHENDSNLSTRKTRSQRRRYQLHLWISEREYSLLKSLAESQDEPMSRIVRRMFGQLKHLMERTAS